ncbi:MAG: ABC transporter ATP-binding protein [bacterium]
MKISTPLTASSLTAGIASHIACKDLNLTIEPQQSWGILGVNGVGKTTLLHTLAGLRSPLSGHINLFQESLDQMVSKRRARQLGILFQRESLPFPVTVLEAVLAGRHPHLGKWGFETPKDIELATDALKQVGMEAFVTRNVQTLSGGELQRVAIATLLAQAPSLALLDEPSNHLDLAHQIMMLDMLTERFTRAGHAMIMVLHDVNLAIRYCDHMLILNGDGGWQSGPTEEIATPEILTSLYGLPLKKVDMPTGYALLPA